jgi:Flp pilus assembly protein TadG
MSWTVHTRQRERGSATLELAVVSLGLLGVLALLAVAGRTQVAAHAVEEAARDAAREASIARSAEDARATARSAAARTLREQGLRCVGTDIAVDTSGFQQPAGRRAHVAATVTCRVDLADIALPGLPGTRTVTADFTSPLDTYRERIP